MTPVANATQSAYYTYRAALCVPLVTPHGRNLSMDQIPYYSYDKRLLGFITEAQAELMRDVRLVRRKRTGQLKRVIDLSERLHPGEFLGRDVTSRPWWQKNDGQHYRQELESGWVYSLRGKGI